MLCKCWVLTAIVCFSAVVCCAASAASTWRVAPHYKKKSNPIALTKPSIRAGEKIYLAQCTSCHGFNGHGNGDNTHLLSRKPINLNNKMIWQQTDGELFRKIRVGRWPMPGFEHALSATDEWHLINYLRHRFAQQENVRSVN